MSGSLAGVHTLVLNADYRPLSYFPLSICSWQEAIKALLLDRVNVVSEYDHTVHSPSVSLKIPSVVSLKRFVTSFREIPALNRGNLFLRDYYTCQYCGDEFTPKQLTFDHVTPRASGGETHWKNIVAACFDCNVEKGDKLPGKGFPAPIRAPYIPTNRELQRISRELAKGRFHESWEDYLTL